MRRDPSFEHVIFSMTLSVQFSSYVQHKGTPHSLVLIMHQLLSRIFHLEINFLIVFGLTSFSGEGLA
jgi:hypothetical protein